MKKIIETYDGLKKANENYVELPFTETEIILENYQEAYKYMKKDGTT